MYIPIATIFSARPRNRQLTHHARILPRISRDTIVLIDMSIPFSDVWSEPTLHSAFLIPANSKLSLEKTQKMSSYDAGAPTSGGEGNGYERQRSPAAERQGEDEFGREAGGAPGSPAGRDGDRERERERERSPDDRRRERDASPRRRPPPPPPGRNVSPKFPFLFPPCLESTMS